MKRLLHAACIDTWADAVWAVLWLVPGIPMALLAVRGLVDAVLFVWRQAL